MELRLPRKRDAAPPATPAWRPNFRNFERLPETGAVRRQFFINALTLLFAVIAAGWLGMHEYEAYTYRKQAQFAETEFARSQRQSAEAVRMAKTFAAVEKKTAEAAEFTKAALTPSELPLLLGSLQPSAIHLQLLDLRLNGPTPTCTIRGNAAGSKNEASGIASAYVEALRANARLKEVFESVTLTAINADERSGTMIFEIVLKLKSTGKGGK